MLKRTTNSENTAENNNWPEKMLLAAVTNDWILYTECANNMDMSSYLQQPSSVTALKLATMKGSANFIAALIGDACRKSEDSNVDYTQGVYGYLKQEVGIEDLFNAIPADNQIESLPKEEQKRVTTKVAQIFASNKITKADEIALQFLMKHNNGMISRLLPDALRNVVQNNFKIPEIQVSEKTEQMLFKAKKILEDYEAQEIPSNSIPELRNSPKIFPQMSDNSEQDMERKNAKQSPRKLSQIIKSSMLPAATANQIIDEAENNPTNCKSSSGR